jgi:hypothetical protein
MPKNPSRWGVRSVQKASVRVSPPHSLLERVSRQLSMGLWQTCARVYKTGDFCTVPADSMPVQGVSFCPMLEPRERAETCAIARGCFSGAHPAFAPVCSGAHRVESAQPEQSSPSRPSPSRPWQPQRRRAAGGQRRRGRGGRREKGLYFSYTLRGEAHAKGAGVKAGTHGAAMERARAPGP